MHGRCVVGPAHDARAARAGDAPPEGRRNFDDRAWAVPRAAPWRFQLLSPLFELPLLRDAQGDRGAGSEGGGESGFPEYLVAVRATHDHQHSCSRPDCAVRLSAALSLPHSSSLPPSYVCLDSSQLGELRRAYCRLHCQRPTIPPAARLLQHPPPTLGPPLPTTCKEVVFPDRASLEAAAAAARMAGALSLIHI